MKFNLVFCFALWETICTISAQTCYLACGDNCWSNGTCIKTGKTNCHPSCQHGCLSNRETDCCSYSCFSRCHGNLLNRTCQQHEGCTHFYTPNGDCVDKCQTSQFKYSIRSNKLTPNSEAELVYRKTCFSSCPENFLEYDGTCVTKCPEGFATTAEQPNKCSKCRDGYCYSYKPCRSKRDEDINVVPASRGCTSIKGNVILWDDAVDTLYDKLISIKEINGSLLIWMSDSSNTSTPSLSSLKNLEVVKGNRKLPKNLCRNENEVFSCEEWRSIALIINLVGKGYTGLDNLRRVQSAAFIQSSSTCHPKRSNLLRSLGVNNTETSLSQLHRYQCGNKINQYPCDIECYDDCTGPGDHQCLGCPNGATDCRKCKNFLQGSRCVYKCNGQFYMKQSGSEQICADCHSECVDGCTGPDDTDCAICKNYRLRNHCIKECPPNTQVHEDSKTCLPCQSGCTQVVEVPRIYKLTVQVDPNGYLSWKLTLHNYCGSLCRADITGIRFVLSDRSGSKIYSRTFDAEDDHTTSLREPTYKLQASTLYSYMVNVVAETTELTTRGIPTHFILTGKRVLVIPTSVYIMVSDFVEVKVIFDAWESVDLHIAPSKVGVTLVSENLSTVKSLSLSDQSEVIESIDEGSFRLRRVRYSVMIILPPKNFTNLVREEFLRYRVDFYDSTGAVQYSKVLLPSEPTTAVPNGISASTKIIIVLGSVVLLFFIITLSAIVYKTKKANTVAPQTELVQATSYYEPGTHSNAEHKQRRYESQSCFYPANESVYPKAGKSGYSLPPRKQGAYDSVYFEVGEVYDQPVDYYGQYSAMDYSAITPLPAQPPLPLPQQSSLPPLSPVSLPSLPPRHLQASQQKLMTPASTIRPLPYQLSHGTKPGSLQPFKLH